MVDLEQLQDFFDQSDDWIFIIKPDSHISWVNQKICTDLGHDREAFIGHPVQNFVKEKVKHITPVVQKLFSGKPVHPFELELIRKDGRSVWVQIQSSQVFGESLTLGTLYVARDISLKKQLETTENGRSIEQLQDTFLSNISHELRTPITNLKLYHDLIQRNPAKQDVYLEYIEKEINRLHMIVDNLLNFISLEQGLVAPKFGEVYLNEMIAIQIANKQELAAKRQIRLQVLQDIDMPPVWGDANLLGLALETLITNAINYTPENGRIVVSTQKEQYDHRQWIGISVRDTGPGISETDFPRIFDRFFRGEASRTAGTPGTGLGLAIAKEIIELHKGRLTVENIETGDGGVRFAFWLPFDV